MTKEKIIFRVVIGLIFLIFGVKNFLSNEYLLATITAFAGITFITSIFIKQGQKK